MEKQEHEISWHFGDSGRISDNNGLRYIRRCRNTDRLEVMGGSPCLTVETEDDDRPEAHFLVNRDVLFKEDPLELLIDIFDDNKDDVWIEYDAVKPDRCDQEFGFTETPRKTLEGSRQWVTLNFSLGNPRFLGGFRYGDFRVVKSGSPQIPIRKVALIGATTKLENHIEGAGNDLSTIGRTPIAVNPGSIRFKQAPHVETSIVVPVHERLPYTLQCLRSLQLYTQGTFEVIVVDDGSADGTPDVLSEIPGVRLVALRTNQGFARACNRGAREARGRFLVFVNNDTVAQQNWLSALLGCFRRHPNAGAVGAKLIYPETREIQHAGVSLNKSGMPYHSGQHQAGSDETANTEREVTAVTGACLLTSKRLFVDMKGFDERFVNGYEDTDYCFRLRELGYKTIYCPDSVLYHYESLSSCRMDEHAERRNGQLYRELWQRKLLNHHGPMAGLHPASALHEDTARMGNGSKPGNVGKSRI